MSPEDTHGDQDTASAADTDAHALADQLFAMDRAAITRDAQDELAHRRSLKDLRERYERLTPDELARMDTEMAVFADAEHALHEGRAAFSRGELDLAEHRLQVAAAHGMGDAVVYLAALHRRRNRDDLAAAWWSIAAHEGFDENDLTRVERLPHLACEDAAQSEQRVADT